MLWVEKWSRVNKTNLVCLEVWENSPVGTFSDPLSNTELRGFSKMPQMMFFWKTLNHILIVIWIPSICGMLLDVTYVFLFLYCVHSCKSQLWLQNLGSQMFLFSKKPKKHTCDIFLDSLKPGKQIWNKSWSFTSSPVAPGSSVNFNTVFKCRCWMT